MEKTKQIKPVGDFAKYLDATIKVAGLFGAGGCAEEFEYKGWFVRIALKKKKLSNT